MGQSSSAAETQHPVLDFEARLATRLGQGEGSGLIDRVGFMTSAETAAALRAHRANQARMDALRLALIAHAERVGVPAAEPAGACVTMEAWLRSQLLMEPAEARRQVKLARRLDAPGHEPSKAALAAGKVDVAAVRVILETVDGLPKEVDRATRAFAEQHLLAEARQHHPQHLRMIATRLDEVLDPEGADQRLAEALARAEAKAARESHCRLWFDEVEQSCTGAFKTDLVTGRRFGRMLEALMSPGRPDPIPLRDEEQHPISADERRGRALIELIERIDSKGLPTTGGVAATVVVTMTLETLTGGAKAAVLDTGERLSPGAARRLAAASGVIPAVLGTRSEVLDLGRRARLASKKQRLAMSLQQRGRCAEEQCDRPITWSDAAHVTAWSDGGSTNLANLVMPCRRHHRLADHPDYEVTRLGPGRIRINRRT